MNDAVADRDMYFEDYAPGREIRTAGVTVRPFTGPVLEVLRQATTEVLAEEGRKSPEFQEILDSYNRFRR